MPQDVADYLLGQIASNTAANLHVSLDIANAIKRTGASGGASHPANSPTTTGFKAQAQAMGPGSSGMLANVRELIYPGGASSGGNLAQSTAGALAGARLQAQGGPGAAALTSLSGLAGAGAVGALGFAAIKLVQNELFPGNAEITSNKGSLDTMDVESGEFQKSLYGLGRDLAVRQIPNGIEAAASAVAGWFGSAVHNGPR